MTAATKNAPGAVTASGDFWPTSEGQSLFSVRDGIPLGDAFDQLTLLIGSAADSLMDCEDESEQEVASKIQQTSCIMKLAFALVRSMHNGYMKSES